MKIYVVIGSQGEYSDREEWVAGVYGDKATAIGQAEMRLAQAKARQVTFDAWMKCYWDNHPHRFQRMSVEERELLDRTCGPCPPASEADDYTVVEAELGVWGRWETVK